MVYAYIEAILALLLHTFTASLFVWLAYAKVLMPSLDLPYFSYREILFIIFAINRNNMNVNFLINLKVLNMIKSCPA